MPYTLPKTWMKQSRLPYQYDGIQMIQQVAFSCKNGKTSVEYGSLDPNGVGYIYKFNATSFEKLDEWQWISKTEDVPVEVICICVRDFLHTITFSEKATEIQKILYG